jgi:hypothetical protein
MAVCLRRGRVAGDDYRDRRAAIIEYNVDDALKIWTAMTTVIGVVTGAFVTYFFSRGSIQEVRQRADAATSALGRLAGKIDPQQFSQMLADDPGLNETFSARQR